MMKTIFHTTLLIFMIAFCSSPILAQGFPWQDFKLRTLKNLGEMEKDVEQSAIDGMPSIVLRGDGMLTRAHVIYNGSTRPISGKKKESLAQWAQMYTQSKDSYPDLYQMDVLFTEGGVEYWLPVQKKVIPYFDKELKKGDEVDLFIVRAGGIYDKNKAQDKWDWLWLVEEFQKPREKPASQ